MSRLLQFDVLKGIGILFVLMGHTELADLPKELIYGFHMPLFFFCSGIFFKDRSLKDAFMKNFSQLIVPYFFFLLVLNLSYFLVNLHAGQSFDTAFVNAISDFDVLDEGCHLYKTIWFLPCLFMVRVLYVVVQKIINNLAVNLCVGGGLYVIGYSMPETSLFVDTAMSVYIYYALGTLFFATGLYKQKINLKWSVATLIVYVAIIVVFRPQVNLKDNIYPWYLFLVSTAVIYAFYQISYQLTKYKNFGVSFLQECGLRSLTLFGFHTPLWLFVYPVCLILHLSIPLSFVVEMLSALVIIMPLHSILSKYTPKLIGK